MGKITHSQVKQALNEVAATEEGRIVLAALKDRCHWDNIMVASGDPQATHFYAAMRGVYAGIRQNIKPDLLKKIEFDYEIVADIKKVKKSDGKK